MTYTPNGNFVGTDSFTYTITDTGTPGLTSTALVTVIVTPVNDAPVANPDTGITTPEDTSVVIDVLANDTDPDGDTLTVNAVTQGINGGTVTLAGGVVTFTPASNFVGTDIFAYTVTDGTATSAQATVTVVVTNVDNDAPVAFPDTVTAIQNNPLVIDTAVLLINDKDPDGGTLTVTAVSNPTGGTVSLTGDQITFTPTVGAGLPASFTYTITDNTGLTANGIVTVNVVADTGAPTAIGVQTTVGGVTPGLAEAGDTIVFTFSEPINPNSVLAGWNGSTTNVVVRIQNNGVDGISNDQLRVFAPGSNIPLPLGTVDLGHKDYVTGAVAGGQGGTSIQYGATGTPSTMTMSGNTITIVLGTYNGGTTNQSTRRETATGTATMVWTPTPASGLPMTDLAGNPILPTPIAESGADDLDF